MAITFYYGSGSAFSWRVWLALEHKKIPYELKLLSFSAGDTKKPAYLAINPRSKVPAISDNGFNLYESAAILDYLDEQYPPGPARPGLFPADIKQRAITRRHVREIDEYLGRAVETLINQYLFTDAPQRNNDTIQGALASFDKELQFWESQIRGPFIEGEVSAADFTLYPFIAMARRFPRRVPGLDIDSRFGPALRAWIKQVEALPYFEKTIPPHWKQA